MSTLQLKRKLEKLQDQLKYVAAEIEYLNRETPDQRLREAYCEIWTAVTRLMTVIENREANGGKHIA